MNRRELLGTVAGTVMATTVVSRAQPKAVPRAAFTPVAPGTHKPIPLAFTRDLRIAGSGGHAPALAAGIPIFVIDMFEHAYAMVHRCVLRQPRLECPR
jgi:hypothetical protein